MPIYTSRSLLPSRIHIHINQTAALGALCLSPLGFSHLLLLLLLEVSLLSLGVEALELGITLGLAGLLLLDEKLLLALALGALLELADGVLADGADLLGDLRAEVGNLDEDVGELEEVREERQEGVVVAIGGQGVLEEQALAGEGLFEGEGLVDGLVGDDHVLKQVAGGLNGSNKLGGKQGVGDLGALAHDSEPGRKLRVILGESERYVVSLVADSAHDILVNNTPDEAIVGALSILGADLRSSRERGHSEVLLAVEWVGHHLNGIRGRSKRLDEEAGEVLKAVDDRVELLGESELDVGESRVLSAGSVGRKLKEGLLLDEHFGVDILVVHGGDATEAYESVLLVEDGGVGTDPGLSPGAIATSTDHVKQEDDTRDEEDDALHLELGDGMTLVDIVPLGEGDRGSSGGSTSSCRILGDDLRSRTRSFGEVGKV
jgi:hypothetical protein